MKSISPSYRFRHGLMGSWSLLALTLFLSLAAGKSHYTKASAPNRPVSPPLRVPRSAAGDQPPAAPRAGRHAAPPLPSMENMGRLPLGFERNDGQAGPGVKFLSHGRGYTLFLTGDEAVLELKKSEVRSEESEENRPLSLVPGPLMAGRHRVPNTKDQGQMTKDAVLRMTFVGANRSATVAGVDELPGKTNYYRGNDPKKWQTGVPNYARVQYRGIYPGIDLAYYGNQGGQLEYDFVVAPGADPVAIRIALSREAVGAVREPPRAHRDAPLRIAADGDLVVQAEGGDLRFHKPVVYQEQESGDRNQESGVQDETRDSRFKIQDSKFDNRQSAIDHQQSTIDNHQSPIVNRQFLDGHYVLLANHQVGFKVAAYDHSKPLIIDPYLVYSTYIGATNAGGAVGIGVDASGNTYLVGPSGVGPSEEMYVVGLSAQGNAYLYTTYVGGSSGAEGSVPYAIAVDSQGDAYITGVTGASNFPITSGAYLTTCGSDCYTSFATKFSPTGALVYSTYLAEGINNLAEAIAVDSSGAAYITGTTYGDGFPVVNAFQPVFAGQICTTCSDAFVQKLNPSGSQLVYSTYFGNGTGTGIAVDGSGSVYVVGNSASVPLKNPIEQGVGGVFLAKFTPDGSGLVYSTHFGGSAPGNPYANAEDTAVGVAVDAAGDAYVTGQVVSADFPLTMNAFRVSCTELATGACQLSGVYALKVAPDGGSLVYSTYLGPGTAWGIALDSTGAAWVVGTTASSYYPVLHAIESSYQEVIPTGYFNGFVTRLDPTGLPTFSTYLAASITGSFGTSIAVDGSGNAYVTGSSGTESPYTDDFPIVNPAPTTSTLLSYDAYVTQINPAAGGPVLSLSPWYTPILSLRNVSDQPLTLNSITPSSTLILEENTCGSSLAPGAGCKLILAPPDPFHLQDGTLTISSSALGSPQSFSITASTGSATEFLISPGALEFPAQLVGTTSSTQTVTLTNLDYPNPVAITTLAASSGDPEAGIAGDFSQTNNCPASLAPGASCTVNVQYQPTAGADGVEYGQLNIDTDYLSVGLINMWGMKSSSSLVASGGSNQLGRFNAALQFGSQLVGATYLPRVVSLTNVSTQQITLSGFTVTGPFSQTNNCSGALAPQTSCRVSVSFVPNANGYLTGTVAVGSSGQGSPTVINLAGTGYITSDLGVAPVSLQFGSQLAGTTSSQPLTLTNLSSTTINILEYDLTANFSQTNNCPGSLAPGATCTVTVSFTPSTLGTINGTLSIQHSGKGSPQVVSLSGTGTTALLIIPQEVSFVQQMVGSTSSPQTVFVDNSGALPVTISSVSISGDFVLLDNTCLTTLAGETNCSLEVEFNPTANGSLTGAITVVASDLAGTHTIPLSGTGVTLPIVNLSPTLLTFPAALVSSTSAAQTVTVSNTGIAPLQISSISTSGPFSQTNTCSAPVAVNGSCSISVTYTPIQSGNNAGWLTIVDNAAVGTQSVPLSGTGEDFSLALASGSYVSTVTRGQSATYNLSVAPGGGLTGSVSFTCTGAPSEATCSVSPSPAPLSASGATPITVAVTTTAAARVGGRPQPPAPPWIWLWTLALLGALGVWMMAVRRCAWRRTWAPLIVVTLGLTLLAACGGGGSGGGTGSPVISGTPAGTYPLTVNGSYTSATSTIQHSFNLTLTVN